MGGIGRFGKRAGCNTLPFLTHALALVIGIAMTVILGLGAQGEAPEDKETVIKVLQAVDTRFGPCEHPLPNGRKCEQYLTPNGKEMHNAGCPCRACELWANPKRPRNFSNFICPDGHMRIAPEVQ